MSTGPIRRRIMEIKKVVYLAGAISGAADPRSWRVTADAKFSEAGWIALDPCKLEAAKMMPAALVKWDKSCIMQSNVVLASLNEPSWGTGIEIAFAHDHGIPVIGFTAKQNLSPWLKHYCDVIDLTMEGAIAAIIRYIK